MYWLKTGHGIFSIASWVASLPAMSKPLPEARKLEKNEQQTVLAEKDCDKLFCHIMWPKRE